ncbi:MAG TPA: hypothetical protein VIX87_12355 [Steroidobacteraceae bacterium]
MDGNKDESFSARPQHYATRLDQGAAQAQQFARDTLPTLQEHLRKINQIAAAAGVSK